MHVGIFVFAAALASVLAIPTPPPRQLGTKEPPVDELTARHLALFFGAASPLVSALTWRLLNPSNPPSHADDRPYTTILQRLMMRADERRRDWAEDSLDLDERGRFRDCLQLMV